MFDIVTNNEIAVDIKSYQVEDSLNPSTLEKNMRIWVANFKNNEKVPELWQLMVSNYNLNLLVLNVNKQAVELVSHYANAMKVSFRKMQKLICSYELR